MYLEEFSKAVEIVTAAARLARYLAGLKERLERMGARRIRRKGAWYWVLKADYRPGEAIEI